jgi:5S rRNA maturation endonuclease (ribonuclease M5)
MYDNSTPNDGQTSSTRGNLVEVTKANPCLHCGKPDWCYSIGELTACKRPQYPPAAGWEITSKTDKEGTPFYAPIREKKAIRPRQTRYWEYPARDGSPLVRVVRFDDGEGGKSDWHQERWGKCKPTRQIGWVVGTKDIPREDIPIYRYAEVRKAIANNELIFIAEGEDNVDRLWALGFAATCNIGGSGKWRESDTRDLQGAKIVIIPDRDEPGINHAELLHQQFPEALWLYPFPNSKAWQNLPKSKGLDIADWIEQHQVIADDIKAAIGEKKVFNTPQAANVIRPPQFQVPQISELGGEIEMLLQSDLKKSQLQLKVSELAQKFRMNPADVWKIYREREQELEQEASQEDTRIGIDQLLASQSASVKLSEIFPESLAAPIEILATRMNLKPECYALALISGVSRFLKNGSSTMLVEEWNRYRCRTHGYFGAMIAEASQMKTPVLNAMIADPLAAMRENNQKKFEAQKKAYEVEFEQWKNSKDEDKGPPPDAPVEKFAYITKATWEGIAGMVGRAPTQGILWLCDELAGFFNSANQYRSGKGSDKEDLLECWSGNGAVIARAAGTTVNVGAVSLSIYGNIQPKVLAPFLGDGSDDNGTFARFDFVQQPPALTQITLGLSKIDINPMLQAVYERVDAIPVTEFALDEEARKLFVDYYNHCQRLRLNHPKQGMRAMLGKAAEKVGRVATILHCIHAAHLGGEVSPQIPASRVSAAIKWVEYTTQQALSINIEVCSPDALESNLAKIISLAERKGGTVTARDVLLSFNPKYRPTSRKIREWFGELVDMKYGEVTQKGNSFLFSLNPTSTVSTPSQSAYSASITGVDTDVHTTSTTSTLSEQKHQILEATVDNCGRGVDNNVHTLKSSLDMNSSFSVDTVDVFTSSPKTSPPLMLSCTTESAELADEHHAKMLADKMREAIASSNFEAAKEIVKQVNASTSQLRASFWQNLDRTEEKNKARLLAFANLSEGTRLKCIGKGFEQYALEELTAYDADGHGGITCLLADGRGFTTWIPTRNLRKL